MRSPGFTELAQDQLGYIVLEYEIAVSGDNGSLAEFRVSFYPQNLKFLVHLCVARNYQRFCCLVCRHGVFPRMQCQHLLAVW